MFRVKSDHPIFYDISHLLHWSIDTSNDIQLIEDLLERGADMDEVVLSGTALSIAAFQGKVDFVRLLLVRGAKLDVPVPDGYTALLAAARRGHTEICRLLVEFGSDVNQQHSVTKDSALSYAASGGHHRTLLALLDLGARTNSSTWTGITPLSAACQNGHLANVISLLEAGADLRASDSKGAPPIHKAASKDHAAVVLSLLEYGCHIEQVRNEKYSI